MENGAIDYQYWNLVIAIAGVTLSLLGTLIQGLTAYLVWFGIRVMNSNAKERATQSERRHEEAMKKHDESMRLMEEREEESKRRHEETMRAMDKKHEENMAALGVMIKNSEVMIKGLEESTAALKTLLERTGG